MRNLSRQGQWRHRGTACALFFILGCNSSPTIHTDAGSEVMPADAGSPVPADAGSEGPPRASADADSLPLDVFGAIGNRYWFEASERALEGLNAPYGGIFSSDLYSPVPLDASPSFVEHLLVTPVGAPSLTADFGKVQVRLVGSSTGRPWTRFTLPNFKVDADEFIRGNRIGGFEHLRLNNGVIGTIFREKLVYEVFERFDYPASRASFAWVSGSVWGPGVAIPYTVVESYKPEFCSSRKDQLAGGCANMWEFYGDVGWGLTLPSSCQFEECDSARAGELEAAVLGTQLGPGYEDTLAEWIDWDAFHRYQCLAWVLELPDDPIHALNNTVLVERSDGKFQYLPYSVDLSLNPEYPVSLGGISFVAAGCQSDPHCWAETIETCATVVDQFAAIDPLGMLGEIHAAVESAGMLRPGDEESYAALRGHLEARLEQLPIELEQNRPAPVMDSCPGLFIACDAYCTLPEACVLCDTTGASDAGTAGDAGPGTEAGSCLPPLSDARP
jgi:hypothetical protein